jgi:hypothetical protein
MRAILWRRRLADGFSNLNASQKHRRDAGATKNLSFVEKNSGEIFPIRISARIENQLRRIAEVVAVTREQ